MSAVPERSKAWRLSHRVVVRADGLGAACGIEPGFYGVAVPRGHGSITCPDCRTVDALEAQRESDSNVRPPA